MNGFTTGASKQSRAAAAAVSRSTPSARPRHTCGGAASPAHVRGSPASSCTASGQGATGPVWHGYEVGRRHAHSPGTGGRRPAAGFATGRFSLSPRKSMATGDENRNSWVGKALWIVRESSVEAREGRPLAPSPDESSVEELLQVRVRGGKRGLLIRRD